MHLLVRFGSAFKTYLEDNGRYEQMDIIYSSSFNTTVWLIVVYTLHH